jgi:glutamate-5-semialdehyde dehydrogenase
VCFVCFVVPSSFTKMSAELTSLVTSIAQRARAASLMLATTPAAAKNAALAHLADLIDASQAALLTANLQDLATPEAAALTPASRDRLTLTTARLTHLAASVREVIALPDPVGDLLEETTRPNGLHIRKVRVPIGVIGIIYEARPNVTIDCAILCLKSGNASILRGGKECFHTNTALAALITTALTTAGLPADAVQLIPTTDRAALTALLKLDTLIHCLIPRGGESLIRFVAENSTIPVIKHFQGVCFVYVDKAADLAMAEAITVNAKASRPSACNAAEQLLVHRDVAEKFLPAVARALLAKNVQLRCDPATLSILRATLNSPPSASGSDLSTLNSQLSTAVASATASDYTSEFLDYILAIRVVDSLEAAIATINRDSSNHSDAIITADEPTARRFLAAIDSATVYWNASTRFTDGFEFGYGAEIGISTDRLHARGPMGLRELCSYKFLIEGTGQVRT